MEVSRFQESIHSNDCVSEAVELIWSSLNASITNNWLRTLELPIAIDMTMLKMKKVVAWSVVSHDGVLPEQIDDFLERFAPEAEPTPISIDPWARGTGISRAVMSIVNINQCMLKYMIKIIESTRLRLLNSLILCFLHSTSEEGNYRQHCEFYEQLSIYRPE